MKSVTNAERLMNKGLNSVILKQMERKSNDKQDPLITVIVPTYNAERYIEDCIESIEKQTYRNFEIIVINDESPDAVYKKLIKLKSKYSNIRIYSEKNSGQGYARNFGINS